MKNKIDSLIKEAMKSGDVLTKDTLRVLKGEIERNEQTKDGKVSLSDIEIQRLVKKLVEGIKETNPSSDEIAILTQFLPTQMTIEEMDAELNEVLKTQKIDSAKGLGIIMKHFKDNFDGLYDGKKLSEMVKSKF